MEKDTRVKIAFALNFILPGFGVCFSGAIHQIRSLLWLGLGISIAHLIFGPLFLASYNLYVLFASSSVSRILGALQALAVSLIIACLGAVVESDIREKSN